jgi:hypothetical protein
MTPLRNGLKLHPNSTPEILLYPADHSYKDGNTSLRTIVGPNYTSAPP